MTTPTAEAIRLIRKGRRAERRGKALEGCLVSLLTSILGALIGGLCLMVAVGIAHAEWIPALPTIGYWWAVLLGALLRGVFSRTESKKEA